MHDTMNLCFVDRGIKYSSFGFFVNVWNLDEIHRGKIYHYSHSQL